MGNSRIAFTDEDEDGVPEVIQENHYYPFGMNMEGSWSPLVGPENRYLYNGKELNEDFGLDWLDYGARWYDPSIARWNAIDPLAESYYSHSPYNYTLNNPIRFIDPDGMRVDDYYVDEDGNYLGQDGADTDDVRVIDKSLWTGVGIGAEDGVNQKTELGTETLQLASTKLSEYEGGIAISDGTWNAIEADGGEKMTPTVDNQGDADVVVLPESYTKDLVTIEPGEGYYPGADGIKTEAHSADQVYKIGDGGKVSVDNNGKVSTTEYSLGHSIFNPGTKNKSYLRKQYKTSKLHGDNWKRLYDSTVE